MGDQRVKTEAPKTLTAFQLPIDALDALDALGTELGRTRSDLLREGVLSVLTGHGVTGTNHALMELLASMPEHAREDYLHNFAEHQADAREDYLRDFRARWSDRPLT